MLRLHFTERKIEGKRLGRHVAHDPRSLTHPAKMAPEIISVEHKRNVPVFDQGDTGSCTGNAVAGCLSTEPFTNKLDEADAVKLYSAGTRLDRIKGTYPPNDTGSSGLAVMRAAKNAKLVEGYSHAFGITHVLKALVLTPGITGITWLTGCDEPDSDGVVRYEGDIRGGHEIELFKIDAKNKLVWFWNSWGPRWGKDGAFAMTFDDYDLALKRRGDATFPVPA